MPCTICDDGERMCDRHRAAEEKYWRAYFGAQLDDLKHRNDNGHTYGCACAVCVEEYRKLK